MTPLEEIPVRIRSGAAWLEGDVHIADGAEAIIAFPCGKGHGHRSPRHRRMAAVLAEACLGTLLFDVTIVGENDERAEDIALATDRLLAATDWLRAQSRTRHLPIGYLAFGTAAAAALRAAADRSETVGAVVSLEGRPDLAGDALARVRAHVLFIVAGEDDPAIRLHEEAEDFVRAPERLRILPGAGHGFEPPSAFEQAAHLARNWFAEHLVRRPASREA